MITDGLGVSSGELRDGMGDRLYATFTRLRFVATGPLSGFVENEATRLTGAIERAGAGMFFSEQRFEGVTDRIWLDHIPRSERDTIQVFAAVSDHAVGVFQAMSQWRGEYEAFRYEASGGEMRLVFPQTGNRETVRVKAWRCDEGGMDFCLELDGASRGAKHYYSRKGWGIDSARNLDAIAHRIDAVRAQLGAN
jgi:hypothetical protein